MWETSCVVPAPKTVHPREPNHFRQVALTSQMMKTMERIILSHFCPLKSTSPDPNHPGIGVDEAVIYLLHRSLLHLDSTVSTASTVRVTLGLFLCFHTIQPALLRLNMEGAGVN